MQTNLQETAMNKVSQFKSCSSVRMIEIQCNALCIFSTKDNSTLFLLEEKLFRLVSSFRIEWRQTRKHIQDFFIKYSIRILKWVNTRILSGTPLFSIIQFLKQWEQIVIINNSITVECDYVRVNIRYLRDERCVMNSLVTKDDVFRKGPIKDRLDVRLKWRH